MNVESDGSHSWISGTGIVQITLMLPDMACKNFTMLITINFVKGHMIICKPPMELVKHPRFYPRSPATRNRFLYNSGVVVVRHVRLKYQGH
jgi:hypothetical protein